MLYLFCNGSSQPLCSPPNSTCHLPCGSFPPTQRPLQVESPPLHIELLLSCAPPPLPCPLVSPQSPSPLKTLDTLCFHCGPKISLTTCLPPLPLSVPLPPPLLIKSLPPSVLPTSSTHRAPFIPLYRLFFFCQNASPILRVAAD